MDKLKVILVDDEMLIRKLIRMKMDTETLNLDIVGEYSTAVSAYQDMKTLKPDIILSDICMPEIDGISFSERCIQEFPNIKIIIVTGYDDFEYARRSLKAGVFDYLMKPVQGEELNATLKRASDEIRSRLQKEENQKKFFEEMKSNMPALRSIYINQLLIEDEIQDDRIEEKLAGYGVIMNPKKDTSLQVGIFVVRESITRPELVAQIRMETESFFKSDKYMTIIQDSWGRIVIINNGADIPFSECLDILVQMIEKKWECHLRVGISKSNGNWAKIRENYVSALDDMQLKHGSKNYEMQDASGTELEQEQKTDRENWNRLIECMKTGNVELVTGYLDSVLEEIENNMNGKIGRKKASVLYQKLCIDSDINYLDKSNEEKWNWCRTNEDIRKMLDNLVRSITMQKAFEAETEKGSLMNKVLDYIEHHIDHEELGMDMLANEFSISSSHLSRMFKQFTGKTYGELLSDLRLQKMLELLYETDLRDRDIGEKIGIRDAHYLSIWFRKMTGYSVTEYRKLDAEK